MIAIFYIEASCGMPRTLPRGHMATRVAAADRSADISLARQAADVHSFFVCCGVVSLANPFPLSSFLMIAGHIIISILTNYV